MKYYEEYDEKGLCDVLWVSTMKSTMKKYYENESRKVLRISIMQPSMNKYYVAFYE